jgi:alpha-beta hydrolase superfamily lysophospholipase
MFWPDNVDQQHLPELSPLGLDATLDSQPWLREYCAYYDIDFEQHYPGLEHFIGYFTAEGERIATQVFRLPNATRTAWVYHGYYDHVGLFNNVINYCLKHGLSVVAFDLPGHGLSSGERAAIDSFFRYRRVLRKAFEAVGEFSLPARKVAIAQSTGCAIVGSHLLDGGSEDFENVVLLAPLVRPCDFSWGRPLHAVLKYFMHSIPRRFADNSDDQAFLEFLRERDPLQPRILPLSWVGALKDWLRWFVDQPACDTPVLILQGDADATVDWRYNLPVLRGKYRQLHEVMIAGARHHLVKEGEQYRAQLWQAMDDFLQLGEAAPSLKTPA